MARSKRCEHEWEIRSDDGHVCEYVCLNCGHATFQERDAKGQFTIVPKKGK